MATPASQQRFDAFDFGKDERWLKYLDSLYPTPPRDKILKFKKKWYKSAVDPEFDVNWEPAQSAPSAGSNASYAAGAGTGASTGPAGPSSSAQAPPSAGSRARPAWTSLLTLQAVLYGGMLIFAVFYVLPLLGMERAYTFYHRAFFCAAAATALGVIHKNGTPKFSKAYLQAIMMDDDTHYFIFAISFMSFTPFAMALVPLAIMALITISDFSNEHLRTLHPGLFNMLQPRLRKVADMRLELLHYRGVAEIMIAFFTVVLMFTGSGSIMTIFVYLQFLRLRFAISHFTRSAASLVGNKIESWTRHPACPAVVGSVFQKVRSVVYNFVRTDQQQQRSACTIM